MYAGTYGQKKVIKLAPDAIVRINGSTTIEICSKCKAKINLSKYVTNISTSLANNTTIGNAQFSIAMPRHGDDGVYMVRGGKVHGLNLMDEVEIFIKGRFPNSNNNYDYYKCFWGVITSVSESYSGGAQNVSVSCESMLKWLQLMKTNEHPSAMAYASLKSRTDIDAMFLTGKTYANMTPYQIIYSLVNITYLNMVVPSVLDTEQGTVHEGTSETDKARVQPVAGFGGAKDIDLLNKWNDKFSKIKGSLKMFGTSEQDFKDVADTKQREAKNQIKDNYAGGKTKNTPIQVLYNSRALMDFKPFFKYDDSKSIDVITNTYKNNLEIASEVRVMSGFEFYLDTTGDIIFKPPFWNVDVRKNKVHTLKDEDIVSWDFQESEEAIVTRVEVTGSLTQEINVDSYVVPRGIFTNYNWARQFGIRTEQISMRFFTSANMCYYHAISEMDRINSARYKGSITMIGRPELRLGLPIYIESRDIFGYIDNISHNFTFGGPFQTQIHISAIRKKYFGDDPMSSGDTFAKEGDSFVNGKYKGDSVILLYKGESNSREFYEKVAPDYQKRIKEASEQQSKLSKDAGDALARDPNRLLKTNREGVYEEARLNSPAAQKALKFADDAKEQVNRDTYLDFLNAAIPVSDEDGYELIGTYENGRSIYLDANGALKKKGGSFSEILSKSLSGLNKNNTYAGSGIANASISDVKTNNAVLQPNSVMDPDKTLNTDKDIRDYYKDKAIKLSVLQPESDKKIDRGCSCFDPGLSSRAVVNNTASSGKSKPIGDTSRTK